MTVTTTSLTKAAGISAAVAGLLFIAVQINHPPMDVSSVTTTEWAVRFTAKLIMAATALAGITGMYLRQVRQTGILGLVGYLLFSVGYLVMMGIEFVGAYVLPSLAHTAPAYVNDVLAAAVGGTVRGDIGLMQPAFVIILRRIPGGRCPLRHRAVPRPRPGPLGFRAPRPRYPRHACDSRAAALVREAARGPDRRRPDRPGHLPLARPAQDRRHPADLTPARVEPATVR